MRPRLLHSLFFLAMLLMSATAVQAKGRSIAELVAIIDGPESNYDFVDRYDAIEELAKQNSEAAAKELAARLGSQRLGHAAAYGLANMDNPAAATIVVGALASADEWERSLLCVALGRMGGPDAIAALIDRMDNDSKKWVRRQAIYALGQVARQDPSGPATTALVRSMEQPELADIIQRELWAVRSPLAATAIRGVLGSSLQENRSFACRWLRARHDTASTEALFALIKSERDDDVVAEAILALAEVHPQNRTGEVVNLLTQGLESPDPSKALRALGRILERRGRSFPPKMSASIASSLHRQLGNSNGKLARFAVIAAGKLGDPSTAERVIPLLKSNDSYMRSAAFDALAATMTKPREAKELLAAIEQDRNLLSSFRTIEKRSGVAKLVLPALHSSSSHVRGAAASLLERLADPIAAPALLKALTKESDRAAAGNMAGALRATRNVSVVAGLVPLLSKKTAQVDVWEAFLSLDRQQGFKATRGVLAKGGTVGLNIVSRLRGYPGDEVVLQWAASHGEGDIRRAAASQLSHFKSLTSVGLLCGLLRDSDRGTREAAAKALGRIPRLGSARCLVDALPKAKQSVLWKEAIYGALRSLSGEDLPNEVGAWKSWLKGNGGLGKGVPGLAVALQSGSEERILMAANAAARLPKEQVRRLLPALLGALDKTHRIEVRVVLIKAIAVAGANSSQPILMKDLERVSSLDELAARAEALYGFGNQSGVVLLVERLEETRRRDDVEKIAAALASITGEKYSTSAYVWTGRIGK